MKKLSICTLSQDLAKAQKLLALGNTLFNLNNPENIEFAAEHFRQAIFKNAHSHEAILMLVKCFRRGTSIQAIDIIDPRLGGYQKYTEVHRYEFMAQLIRKALVIKPDCIDAIYLLSSFFSKKEVTIMPEDIRGTEFQSQALDQIDRDKLRVMFLRKVKELDPNYASALCDLGVLLCRKNIAIISSDLCGLQLEVEHGEIDRAEVVAELFRKARSINPNLTDATWNLVVYLIKGAPICDRDKQGTRFAGKDFPIRRNELVAELLRLVILKQPYRSEALTQLAICISNGATMVEQDLAGTPYADAPLQSVTPEQLELALYEKALNIDPDDQTYKKMLSILQEKMKAKTSYLKLKK